MTIKKTAIPQRNDSSFVEKMLDDEIILYDKSSHNIHNLNRTAAILWNLCDGKMTINEILRYLFKNTKGDKKVIEHEVMNTLAEMEGINLITFINVTNHPETD